MIICAHRTLGGECSGGARDGQECNNTGKQFWSCVWVEMKKPEKYWTHLVVGILGAILFQMVTK